MKLYIGDTLLTESKQKARQRRAEENSSTCTVRPWAASLSVIFFHHVSFRIEEEDEAGEENDDVEKDDLGEMREGDTAKSRVNTTDERGASA